MSASTPAIPPSAASVEPAFTGWLRGADDEVLLLLRDNPSEVLFVEVDIRDLPDRPDLLARLTPTARDRLLLEAHECRRGNFTVNPQFPGYSQSPDVQARAA